MFIALEGGDGAGKSTQIPLLKAWLEARGLKVTVCREPGSTQLGESIREILLFSKNQGISQMSRMSELLLFMAARAQLVAEIIRPALERGEVVLADRFLLSSVVYQGWGGELDVEQIRQIGQIATGGVVPDLNIVLDVPLSVAKARRMDEPDRLESEADAFHERVRVGFLAEAALAPEKCVVISAEQSVEAIFDQIKKAVERELSLRDSEAF